MALKAILGQARTKRFLQQLVRSGHIPHALLFSGMAGTGKTAVAREFSKLLNCRDVQDLDCCDGCDSCRKAVGGHHPDLVWVRSDGAFIKIEQIRGLKEHLRFRPFESPWRVIVIEDAQNLREESSNALLKLLEEPPQQNLFILTVPEPQMLLPTIVSRCCHIRFQPLDEATIAGHLIAHAQLPPARAREVARQAEGSLQRAQWLAEANLVARWQETLDRVKRLGELSMVDFFPLMAQWAQQSENLEQDLECIGLWLHDLVLSRLITGYHGAFDLDADTHRAAPSIAPEHLFALYDQIEQAIQDLRRNANKQLTLEGVCLALKDNFYGKGRWNSLSQRR